nr:MAG TPA: hypothetical protein [Caudoviricetes sp.]
MTRRAERMAFALQKSRPGEGQAEKFGTTARKNVV